MSNSYKFVLQYLQRLKDNNYRIIIGDFYDDIAREVMCEAYHKNMTAEYGYIWFLPLWFTQDWFLKKADNEIENAKCTSEKLLKVCYEIIFYFIILSILSIGVNGGYLIIYGVGTFYQYVTKLKTSN